MVKVLIKESFGSEETTEKLFVQNDGQSDRLVVVDHQSDRWITMSSIKLFFTVSSQSVFLPSGYPESVSDDYMSYQLWDSIQAFASSIMNNLGTHSILKGVGVGDATATVLAATITWLLRDGTSMTGRILFAYIQSSKLDAECKKWRLFADLINDFSIFIDLLSPYFQNIFLYLQCFSGVLKSLVGTAGGATRAALTQHQSRRNNLADVSAKDGSQETLVNLTALICSLIIVPVVSENTNLVWILFVSFTLLHIYANYRAVHSVSIEVFNLNRFAIFVENYLQFKRKDLTVKCVNSYENVWFFTKDKFDVYNDNISIGASLQSHITNAKQLNELIALYSSKSDGKDCQYILNFMPNNKNRIQISLKKSFESSALFEAVFQAILICFAQKSIQINDPKVKQMIDSLKTESNDAKKVLELSRKYTTDLMKDLKSEAIKQKWDLNKVLFITNEWRFQFED